MFTSAIPGIGPGPSSTGHWAMCRERSAGDKAARSPCPRSILFQDSSLAFSPGWADSGARAGKMCTQRWRTTDFGRPPAGIPSCSTATLCGARTHTRSPWCTRTEGVARVAPHPRRELAKRAGLDRLRAVMCRAKSSGPVRASRSNNAARFLRRSNAGRSSGRRQTS